MTYPAARVWELLQNVRMEILDAAAEPELVADFDYVARGGGAWLLSHPSGFHAEGVYFDIDAEVICRTITQLDDEQADEYVMCISDWLWSTTLDHAEGVWTADAIVLAFAEKYPAQTIMLGAIAQQHGHSLVEWLAGLPQEG